jgi:hypothetical protein
VTSAFDEFLEASTDSSAKFSEFGQIYTNMEW